MDHEEALALADKYVSDWTEQTKNVRGYVHDKWTPVEVKTRTEAVLQVADWLLQRGKPVQVEFCNWCPDPPYPSPVFHPDGSIVHQVPPAQLLGWPVDGSKGPPTEAVYRFAIDWLQRHDPTKPVEKAMVDGIWAAIHAYEDAHPDQVKFVLVWPPTGPPAAP